MNKQIFYIIIFTFLFAVSGRTDAQLNYGLKLSSRPDNIGNRTTFNLIEKEDFTFQKNFDLSFELFLNTISDFGYICHVIEDSTDICLMYFPHGSVDSSYFDVIIKGKERLLRLPVAKKELNSGKWNQIKLSFLLDSDNIKLSVGVDSALAPFNFKRSYSPTIVFGTYKTSMVLPSVSIKHIILQNNKLEELVNYPLNEYLGTTATDISCRNEIEVKNPDWLAREHYHWKHEYDVVSSPMGGNCFVLDKNSIYLIGTDSALVYNVENNTFSTLKYANKFPLTPLHYDVVYNSTKGTIDVYGFVNGNSYQKEKRISSLDLGSLKWMEPKLSNWLPEHCHHNTLFLEGIEYPVIFGGYGSLKYFDKFITYEPVNEEWRDVDFSGDSIAPRFLASLSQKVAQKYYLFGGFGNESGDQELGGLNYYDLYAIDTKNKTVDKIWVMPKPENDFVGANTMVFDEKDSVFYVLGYAHHQLHTNLVLYRLDYKKNTFEIVSDSIPSSSQTIYSQKDLFYSSKSGKLIAAIREDPGNEETVFRYYSLSFPPIKQKIATEKAENNWFAKTSIFLLVLAVLLLVISALLYIYYKSKKRINPQQFEVNLDAWDEEQLNTILPNRNVILFFGEFFALNDKGKNITYLFSPRLRQLLFLIIIYQLKNKEGISSNQISTTLWPDKELPESKNIRSVTINHLRNALKDIDGIEVVYENKGWKISSNDCGFIDLMHFNTSVNTMVFDNCQHNDGELLKFLSYTSRGNLGQLLGEERIDNSKFEIETKVIDILQVIMSECWDKTQNDKLGLFVSSSVLKIAPFNEDAIQYKLKFLTRMGKIESAESVFERFAANYKKHFNQNPSWNFHEVINKVL